MVREWLIFFGPSHPGISKWFTKREFGHVLAAGYDADLKIWVTFDPQRSKTLIGTHASDKEFDRWLGLHAYSCRPHVLRFAQTEERTSQPMLFSCVAAIKALLGIRCGALSPEGLYKHLLSRGAEIVEVPEPETPDGKPV